MTMMIGRKSTRDWRWERDKATMGQITMRVNQSNYIYIYMLILKFIYCF